MKSRMNLGFGYSLDEELTMRKALNDPKTGEPKEKDAHD